MPTTWQWLRPNRTTPSAGRCEQPSGWGGEDHPSPSHLRVEVTSIGTKVTLVTPLRQTTVTLVRRTRVTLTDHLLSQLLSSSCRSSICCSTACGSHAHDELVVQVGPRRWAGAPYPKVASPGSLRVNVMVGWRAVPRGHGRPLFSQQRAGYTEAAATELRCDRDTMKAELGQVLLAVEDAQAAAVTRRKRRGARDGYSRTAKMPLVGSGALDLMDQVAAAFSTLGVVGEQTSSLTRG